MMEKNKNFYESIGYEPYQEVRVFFDKYWKAFFAQDYAQTQRLLEKYKHHNCYVGVNPRLDNTGMSSKHVAYRRMMIFDLEDSKRKPPLSDKDYRNRLSKALGELKDFVSRVTNGALVTFVVTSGRGLHVYYRLKPLDKKYQPQYLVFYSQLVNAINRRIAKYGIKADPPVKDLPRLFGAPGTKNIKYDEDSAMRKIIFYEDNTYDLEVLMRSYMDKTPEYKELPRRKMNMRTLMGKPEFLIFKYKPRKGTGINNRLRLALKLLMREARFTYEETEFIARKIHSFGFDYKPMYLGDMYPHLTYSKEIIRNYCKDNYEWFFEVGFPFPYPNKGDYRPEKTESLKIFDFEKRPLNTWEDVVQYAVDFNKATEKAYDTYSIFYVAALEYNIKKNCSQRLWKLILAGNLIHDVKYKVMMPKIQENLDEYII